MKRYQLNEVVFGRVTAILPLDTDANQAGVLKVELENGSFGSVPISEVDENINGDNNARHISRRYMGRTIIAKVTQLVPLELSIKAAISERLSETTVEIGQVIEGAVVWVNRKRAEIQYNNCLAMVLPSTEYSKIRIGDLSALLSQGQTIKVEVINIEDGIITVSHKKFAPDPWPAIQKKFSIRGQYLGRVVKLIPAGVFVNLEPGLDVLAAPRPSFFNVYVGDEVALEITDMEPTNGKIKGMITARVSSANEGRKKIV